LAGLKPDRKKPDSFSLSLAQDLSRKRRYQDGMVSDLVQALHKDKLVCSILHELGLDPHINTMWVMKIRQGLGVEPVSRTKGVGLRTDKKTIAMILNLVCSGRLKPPHIVKIMQSIQRPVSESLVKNLAKKWGETAESKFKKSKPNRASNLAKLQDSFKKMSTAKRISLWKVLNSHLKSCKRGYAGTREQISVREPLTAEQERILDEMSKINCILEALWPLLSKNYRKKSSR